MLLMKTCYIGDEYYKINKLYLFLNPTVISTINITSTCFYKQPSCQGSKNKEVKQLAKQPLIVKNANAKKTG